jgi:hypothetical protein
VLALLEVEKAAGGAAVGSDLCITNFTSQKDPEYCLG